MENPFKKLIEEWKKASPKEKLFIVGAAASIVAVALYLHNKSSSSLAGTGTTGLPSSLSPGTGGTGTPGSIGPVPPQPVPGDTGNPPGDTNPPYAPPPYTGTGGQPPPYTGSYHQIPGSLGGTPPSYSGSQHALPGPLLPASGQKVSAPAPGYLPVLGGTGRNVQPGARAVINPNTGTTVIPPVLLGRGTSVTTQVYGSIRHAPAPAPARTFQAAAPPPPVRKPRGF